MKTIKKTVLSAVISSLLLPALSLLAQEKVLNNAATPAIPGVVAGGVMIELVAKDFDGTEGPLGLPDGSLLFTETRAEKVIQISENKQHSVYLDNTNGANALALNNKGELLAVQVKQPRVGVIAPAASVKTLADHYQSKAFNRPNDLVIDSKGGIYFTDSGNTPAANAPNTSELATTVGVYYLSANGELKQLANDIERPNGVQLSADEKTLYVANTLGQHVLAYDISGPGKLGKQRKFAELAGWREASGAWSSGADGLAVDSKGDLYVASNAGVEVFTAEGKALGVIPIPVKPQNLAFAGSKKNLLYVVGRGAVYRFPALVSGIQTRAK